MNKKYKLLKDLPDLNKGMVLTEDSLEQYHCICPKEHPDWFAPYVLTTEDGIDIYKTEKYFVVNSDNIIYKTKAIEIEFLHSDVKRFSTYKLAEKYLEEKIIPKWVIVTNTRNAWYKMNNVYQVTGLYAQQDYFVFHNNESTVYYIYYKDCKEATPAEVEAHKLGFHIGDKVDWTGVRPTIGVIKSFHISMDEVCADLHAGYDSCVLCMLKHYKEEPKPNIITEEGDKLYSTDKCWFINNFMNEPKFRIHAGNCSEGHKGKYFFKERNAYLYCAKLKAEKRGISIGTKIFEKHNSNKYLGEVIDIIYNDDDGFHLNMAGGYFNWQSQLLTTLEELVKEEGLEIGMDLDKDLLKAWDKHNNLNSYTSFNPNVSCFSYRTIGDTNKGEIHAFGDGTFMHVLVGFKKFQDEWKSKSILSKEEQIIEYLWKIIDNIDTVSDVAKNDNIFYRNTVERLQKKRWNTGITSDGYKLDLTKMKITK